jgi:uncharacterized protein YqfB (UPF0267 family)
MTSMRLKSDAKLGSFEKLNNKNVYKVCQLETYRYLCTLKIGAVAKHCVSTGVAFLRFNVYAGYH